MKKLLNYLLFTIVLLAVATFAIWHNLSRQNQALLHYLWQDMSLPPAAPINLLLGSSTLARLDTSALHSCGNWLSRAVGNSQLADIQRYLRWSPAQLQPEHILLYAGENDLARARPVQQASQQYMALLQQLMALYPQAKIHILAIKHSPARQQHWPAFAEVNTKLQAYAKLQPQLHYYDSSLQQPDFATDGIHLSVQGYRRFLHGVTTLCKAAANE